MRLPDFFARWRQHANWGLLLVGVLAAGMFLGAGAMFFGGPSLFPANRPETPPGENGASEGGSAQTDRVVLPQSKWSVAELRMQSAERGSLTASTWVTGKLTLNEDRLAHIYSLIEGRVHEVHVKFGQEVKEGDVLALVDSQEVGTAKLALHRDELKVEFAKVRNDWNQKINENTQALIATLEKQTPIGKIDELFGDKPMGEYRQQLLTAYANLYKSQADYERLKPLAEQGISAGKQALYAKTALEADQATFLALLEQLKFTVAQQALLSEQELQQAEQAVAVSRSQLYILGYHESDLAKIDPIAEGETISHYEIRAPFDGTVIGKNVVLAERVGRDTEMFQLADLSSLWVQADIYQKDLPKINQLGDTLRFRATDSDHTHDAKIFSTGSVLDPETRTARLRALVDNPDRHLKAGMFVEVQLPGETTADVVTVPVSAIQEMDGQSVVFVHQGGDEFERRHVSVGTVSGDVAEIRAGLAAGDSVVVVGGFALKSEMLKELMSED